MRGLQLLLLLSIIIKISLSNTNIIPCFIIGAECNGINCNNSLLAFNGKSSIIPLNTNSSNGGSGGKGGSSIYLDHLNIWVSTVWNQKQKTSFAISKDGAKTWNTNCGFVNKNDSGMAFQISFSINLQRFIGHGNFFFGIVHRRMSVGTGGEKQ